MTELWRRTMELMMPETMERMTFPLKGTIPLATTRRRQVMMELQARMIPRVMMALVMTKQRQTTAQPQ